MLIYLTKFPTQECISRLTKSPLHYRINWLYSRDYEVESISPTQLFITFTRGYNLTDHRTRYQVDFCEYDSQTKVVMRFVDEENGFPYPFVTDYEISKLLEQRIGAKLFTE